MQHHFLFQRAGNDHIDLLPGKRAQNRFGWIALLIMNRCVGWQL